MLITEFICALLKDFILFFQNVIGKFITLEADKMGSLKVKIFEDGPDTLVWKIALECNPVKSSREVKLNSKNVLSNIKLHLFYFDFVVVTQQVSLISN